MLLGPSAWSHSCVLGSVFPLLSASAERKQLSCWQASLLLCPSQRQELDAVYESELLVVVMLLLSWGCWLWSVLPSSRLLTPACLSQAGRERSSQSPPAEAKSRISADFHGRAVYFWEQHLLLLSSARFPPRWGQGSRCSITGVAMGTDRDVTGVGRSGRDSDLIVPLQGRESSPKPQAGLLTKPCR